MEFLLPFLLLVLPSPALSSQDLHSGNQRISRGVKPQPIKVIITDTCAQDGAKGREIDLDPDTPLVLTHQIRLVPGSGQGCGQCEVDIPAMRERIERLEKELSDLREKCGSSEGCCKSQQSKGAVCTTEQPTTDECPDDCNDQGRCVDGKCVCFPGFSGPDCGMAECPDDCNNLGKCVNGQCVCDPGFSGLDCSTSTCPDNCSDKGLCVNGRCVCNPGFTGRSCQTQSCPENCNNHGRCVNSRCVCDAGFTSPDCSETSCPENCNNRGRCVNGLCVCNPGFTGTDCSVEACPENCSNHGRCEQGKCVCESGFTGPDCSSASCPGNCNNHGRCVKSRCVCETGFTGPDCSETSCPENCNKRGRCVNGQCVCNTGFTGPDCSVKACPENCSNHGRCVQGKCICESGFTGPDCSSASCPGNCNNHGRCVKSRCVCDAGFTGPDCSETSCPENCKKRGRCVNGQCVCNPGFTGPDCSVKACPENCSNHGRCVQGKCVCESGFSGPDCSSASCPGNCNNHGRCVKSRCVCDAGFTGPDCSETSCPENCKKRGRCVNGQCVCNPGFTGPDCSVKACPENCSNHGRCVQGKCVCESGFSGPDCSSASCPGNCNNHGRCVNSRCVCDAGFTGPDCSETSCPENCNNRGRCVNGQCVCNPGFTGPDCSVKACPENCNNRGRCEQGKCVCESGFSGPDCSSASCPGNCNNQGRCVDGRCVCESGFTGQDCSSKACPSNCNNKGICVNGKCVCDVGFAGQDCSAKTCPNNCSNRGRCMKGKCICRRGFTGSSCSECESGLTGDNCDIALLGVSNLRTREITESSVSLFWTQPAVQYDTYHITFTSMKDSNQKISSKISGQSTTYIQSGLAAGQEYTVSLTGEKEGMMGAETTAKFNTLISGPKNLQVVKTTTRSVVVKWEKAQGEIDRYVLSVTPNKTSDRLPEVPRDNLPPERDSAQIDGLEPGNLYDISLVAEKDSIQSLPASVQATPGPEPPSNLAFSDVTDSSFTVSWTKPKSKLSGFKITYTHIQEGEPISVSVDSETVHQTLSPVSPGSIYEVRVMSVLGQDESDSIKDTVTTLPDPPTDLRAINITDSKALLLWRPALATIDHYIIMYSSETAPRSGITIKVSGNAAEQQLEALQASSEYRVTVKSQLRDLSSSEATTVLTTSSGAPAGSQADGPQDLKASQVKPRTAVLSWKPPNSAFTSYKLSYYTNGQDIKEVILDPTIKEYKLSRLYPMSKYTALLQVERGGLYMTAISTEFTTGNLRFPFPTDCSQERQNGEQESGMVEVFPQGKQGNPLRVYCDMETDGGGWTVFQRRKNGKTDFYRNWRHYLIGFGELDEEFWLGNEHLHNFTVMSPTMLRVDLKAGDKSVYAQYSSFSVDSRKNSYALKISGYSGTAGDSLSYHDGCSFSTRDRDPQAIITSCAMSYRGGWWYKNCHEANLNGVYNTITNHQGVIWTDWKGKDFSIPFTEMKFRPASFKP
ncbi:Tenascin [Triplophysa tibetana]|uniref:Tenascin n=1 Tax=Triplophysa tibetana TaxID=1572043 RepID=A0A5A9NRB0_9TELE|nr:Tenascin [Triplophysa tibetana]